MDEKEIATINQTAINQSNEVLGLFESLQVSNEERKITSLLPKSFLPQNENGTSDMYFFKVLKLAYDKDYPHREAFENALLSLNNSAFNFVYILEGTEDGINLNLGIVKNGNDSHESIDGQNYRDNLLHIFEGNFNGSVLKPLRGNELLKLIRNDIYDLNNVYSGMITGIPSVNELENGNEVDFQGMDRLINSMQDLNRWRIIITCEPVNKDEILSIQEDIYDIYNRLTLVSKQTLQHSESEGSSISFSTSVSHARGKNHGYSNTKSNGIASDTGKKTRSDTYATSGGTSITDTNSETETKDTNNGTSNSITVEKANKHAAEMMKYIDDELLPRMKLGFSKGMFKTSLYYMAENPSDANRLKMAIMALFQGNKSSFSPLCNNSLELPTDEIKKILTTYQNQYVSAPDENADALTLKGINFDSLGVGLNTLLTSKEISLIAGLPQTEVPGINLLESVGFGLNEKLFIKDKRNKDKEIPIPRENCIKLGSIVQKGKLLPKLDFLLPKKNLQKHTFIAGVTGSGKTTTCHNLLHESNTNFLVLEPAKTEYRTLIKSPLFQDKDKQIVVFTLGNETNAPFRLNPFEMVKGEILSAHIDMVKATFTSAFPMEASMPQLLEEAMYNCYRKRGWDVDTNTNEKYGDKAYDPDVNSFPIMSDLLAEMSAVVETKNFGGELKSNYIGSLVSRLSNLTVGVKGNMLNCEHSTNFDYIATHNVIMEMEDLKNPEDKSLFMGFILARLTAVIRQKHKEDSSFRHITLVEEAHRLLSKVEYGDSGSKKTAVETFTDLLAEVRKYGEGLIIVDQIPNKLAPEVLKNTNTKIIHKILAKDDKETVGDTMLMDDRQKEYLSALEVGNAIVFTEGTDKPVHVKINQISDTNEDEIPDEVVAKRFLEKESELGECYRVRRILSGYKIFEKFCISIGNDRKTPKDSTIEMLKQEAAQLPVSEDIIIRTMLDRFFNTKKSLYETLSANELDYDDFFEKAYSFIKQYLKSDEFDITSDESEKMKLYFK